MRRKSSFIILCALLATCACAPRVRAAGSTQEPESNSEQTLAADPAVIVTLCLASGNIVVRGWDRKEVRARNEGDGQIELRRTDATAEGAPATRIEVLISDSPEAHPRPGQCNDSGDIELDIPRGSSVQLKGNSGDVDVTGVASIRAESMSGTIELHNIARFVEVTTANGDIALTHAAGRVRLRSISGQIEVHDAGPVEASDDLWAKTTSGDITLEAVRHAHVEATTAAGSVDFDGALAQGGFYDLKTTQGDVTMTLPADSSFFVNARVSYDGDIVTDFPIRLRPGATPTAGTDPKKDKPKGNVELSGGNLTGVYGKNEKGDAALNLASFSGSVRLRKK